MRTKISTLRMFVALVAILSSFLHFSALSQVIERQATGQGSGQTRSEAINDAIINAIGQTFGIKIKSLTSSKLSQISIDSRESSISGLVELYNKEISRVVVTPENNPILGFNIDQVVQSENGGWTASISIRYADHVKLGSASERRTIVAFIKDHPQATVFLRSFEMALVAERRFDVLSRNTDFAFDSEKAFLKSGAASILEVSRMNNALGADYIASLEIIDLEVKNGLQSRIRLSGEINLSSEVRGTLRLEILETSSRKKKWIGNENINVRIDGLPKLDSYSLKNIFDKASSMLVRRMTEAIYPIEVVRQDGDRILINRGAGSVKIGDTFLVMSQGDEVFDPQSGESLGNSEDSVAVAEIAYAWPKFATARLIKGKISPNQKYILRPAEQKETIIVPNSPEFDQSTRYNRGFLTR
jgi:hypothetical protein